MAFVVGVGLDRDALLGQFGGQVAQAGHAGVLDLLQPGLVLFDHPLVMVGGDRGQALRQQVVHGVAALDLDDVALRAEVVDGLNQQQLDAVVLAARQPLGGGAFRGC